MINNRTNLDRVRAAVPGRVQTEGLSHVGAYSLEIMKVNDVHVRSYEASCSPCQIHYNAIVKIDDRNATQHYFTKSNFVNSKSRELFLNAGNTKANENDVVPKTTTWKDLLQAIEFDILQKLLEHYRNDFIYYDYKIFRCEALEKK